MADEKLAKVLLSRGLIAPELIEGLSNSEGWAIVRKADEAAKIPKGKKVEICFTGFTDPEKAELIQIVRTKSRFEVVTKVTKQLSYLCSGKNAGEKKLADARQQGAKIISRAELENLIATGEIPQ